MLGTSLLSDEKVDWATLMSESASKPRSGRGLRIALVVENFLPKIDGVTRTVARLLQHLRLEGHEAIVFGPGSAAMTEYCGHPIVATRGIPLVCYPDLKLNFFRPLIIRRLLEFKPDIIHLVDPVWLGAQSLPALQYFLPDVPRVCSFHTNLPNYASLFGFSFLEPTIWRLIRHVHNRCRLTFCPSTSTAEALSDKGFANLQVWSRGVDTSLFRPSARSMSLRSSWGVDATAIDSEKVVLLYVGRISWEKNLRLLVEAARGLHRASPNQPACKLVFVGDGPSKQSIERMCADYGIDAVFCGHLRGERLAAAFASADVFAFPSFTETFGQVVLEAMASGLPVVGLRAEGVRDLVSPARGHLLDFDDLLPLSRVHTPASVFDPAARTFEPAVQRYRSLLARAAGDASARASMAHDAVQFASTFSWTETMEGVISAYKQVVRIARAERYAARAKLSSPAGSVPVSPALSAVSSATLGSVTMLDNMLLGAEASLMGGEPDPREHGVDALANAPRRGIAARASGAVLYLRYGRPRRTSVGDEQSAPAPGLLFGRPPLLPLLRADGKLTPEDHDALDDLEEQPLALARDSRLAFYKSTHFLPRALIICIVGYQLTLWTLISFLRQASLTA